MSHTRKLIKTGVFCPYNLSGEWGKVMGNVINAKYDPSLGEWNWWIERYELLSFVNIITDQSILLWTPMDRQIDFGLYLRPFTDHSWIAIIIMTTMATMGIFVAHYVIPCTIDTNVQRVMVTTLWYFFVLLNAFYGGAMTMFFANAISSQFGGLH
jgi:hypothetical protein